MRLRFLSGMRAIVLTAWSAVRVVADQTVTEDENDAIQRAVNGRFSRSAPEEVPNNPADLSLDQCDRKATPRP